MTKLSTPLYKRVTSLIAMHDLRYIRGYFRSRFSFFAGLEWDLCALRGSFDRPRPGDSKLFYYLAEWPGPRR